MFIVVILLYLFQQIVVKFLGSIILKILCCSCCRKHSTQITHHKESSVSEDIYSEFNLLQLSEFYKRSANELNAYKEMVSTHSYNKDKFDDKVRGNFEAQLKTRISHIEQVIDIHLVNLLRESNMKKNGSRPAQEILKKYSGYNYLQKLTLMMANQAKLLKSENHTKLRMQGTTQSYHMHDSVLYIAARQMELQLQKEDFKNYSSSKHQHALGAKKK